MHCAITNKPALQLARTGGEGVTGFSDHVNERSEQDFGGGFVAPRPSLSWGL